MECYKYVSAFLLSVATFTACFAAGSAVTRPVIPAGSTMPALKPAAGKVTTLTTTADGRERLTEGSVRLRKGGATASETLVLDPAKAYQTMDGFGFAITYKDRTNVVPPSDVDVIMVAPKGSGTSLRSLFLEGRGINSSYAVFQDATGKAEERTMAMGIGIGSGYMFKTTFTRETYSDLTGERGALMGAVQGLFLAQYETLREHGHSPSEAFNETVEEFTQSLLPMVGKNGMDWMYANCSTTAQRGALDWMGPFHDAIKPVMEKLYESVASGHEAQVSIDSNSKPGYRDGLNKELAALHDSEMWRTGETVRKLRPENN